METTILIFERGNRPIVSAEDTARNSKESRKKRLAAAERKAYNARVITNFKLRNQGT